MGDVLESQKPGTASVEADVQLAAMGYKSELPRNLSMMSILGMCVLSPLISIWLAWVSESGRTPQVIRDHGFVAPLLFGDRSSLPTMPLSLARMIYVHRKESQGGKSNGLI